MASLLISSDYTGTSEFTNAKASNEHITKEKNEMVNKHEKAVHVISN